jgi:hypothetical protein
MALKEEDEETTHESFGVLHASRSQQSRSVPLFGSAIRHGHTVTLAISRGRLVRHHALSYESYFAGERLIEVEMSSLQWGEFVSGMNLGAGTPVTIRYFGGKRCEDPPYFSERARIREELREKVEGVVGQFDEDIKEVAGIFEKGSVGKGDRERILRMMRSMQQRLKNSVPYIHEQFDEALAESVVAAKAEVDAHLSHRAQGLGLDALREQTGRLLAGGAEDEER